MPLEYYKTGKDEPVPSVGYWQIQSSSTILKKNRVYFFVFDDTSKKRYNLISSGKVSIDTELKELQKQNEPDIKKKAYRSNNLAVLLLLNSRFDESYHQILQAGVTLPDNRYILDNTRLIKSTSTGLPEIIKVDNQKNSSNESTGNQNNSVVEHETIEKTAPKQEVSK